MAGWRLLFYSQLVSIAYSVLSGSIVGGLLFGLISLYILFQVRPLSTTNESCILNFPPAHDSRLKESLCLVGRALAPIHPNPTC